MTGTRGPLPKPTALKMLEGNPGKRALDLAGGVNPRIEIPTPPKHLGIEARKEWKRITPLLEERFGFTIHDDEIDGAVFATVGSLIDFVSAKAGAT